LATVSLKGTGFAIVLANPIGTGSISISGLPALAKCQVISTDAKSQVRPAKVVKTDAKGILRLDLPASSVTTIVGGTLSAP